MMQIIKDRWLLLLVVTVFIIVKIPALHYPFFWDESWSYAPGVKLMYLHGPSLMPNAIDLFYSRGHPLLFYASAAAWMRFFGDSHVAQHSFALLISILLLVTVYEVCLRLFNKRVATIALLLVCAQEMFFVQSTLLLPEVMIAWLSLLTLYFYSKEKYLLTFIACTALVLTKESGMVLGLVLGVHAAWQLVSKKNAAALTQFASIAGAGIIIGVFFLIQKKVNGWYIFPEHAALMDSSKSMFKGKARFCFEIIFYHQYRYILFILLLCSSIAASIYYRSIRYAAPLILGILLFIVIGDYFGRIPRIALLPLLFAGFVYVLHSLITVDEQMESRRQKFLYLSVIFFIAYHVFTCFNFLSDRYLLCSLIVLMVMTAYCFELFTRPFGNIVFYSLLASITCIAAIAFNFSTGKGDVDMGIFPAMQVQEDVVNYMEQHDLYQKNITSHSNLERVHLTLPYTGYLKGNKTFTAVSNDLLPNTEYIIIDNIEPDSTAKTLESDAFKPVHASRSGNFWAIIFQKK